MSDKTKPYGTCLDCGVTLQTKEASRQHHMDTLPERADATGKRVSHSTQVLNPPREDRLASHIGRIVNDALEHANKDLEELEDLDGGYTIQEITQALRHHSEFHDAWKEYCDEE